MTFHMHDLLGCSPTPLAHYLKALGILRVLSAQEDPDARGSWRDESFLLFTCLTRKELESFFLERYEPTPFLSPWLRGSGFFSAGSALDAVEASKAPRFASYRKAIATAREQLSDLEKADALVRKLKDQTKIKKGMSPEAEALARKLKQDEEHKQKIKDAEARFKKAKEQVLLPCVRDWRGPVRDWLDAALVLTNDGSPSWPALLGSGGNDGRLDFSDNAMKRIADLFDLDGAEGGARPNARRPLQSALWRDLAQGVQAGSVGQFMPGNVGGANGTTGPEAKGYVNAWDFLLMLEGAVVFSSRPTRRLDPETTDEASAPFAVRSHGAGNPTAGDENSARGEQWMPLWRQPASFQEIAGLISEGRAQLGRSTAHRPLALARSLARMGSARGIHEFVRFGYLERNGRSNVAVPLGRVRVRELRYGRLADDLAAWLDSLRRAANDAACPNRVQHAERKLSNALFSVLTHDPEPRRWQSLLLAATEVEQLQASGTPLDCGRIPPLRPEWLEVADDGSGEWRLACALGLARGTVQVPGSLRAHWFQEDPNGASRRVAQGRDAISDLVAVVQRRLLESQSERCLPILPAYGFAARLDDLAAFLAGNLDEARIVGLARALMAVRAVKDSFERGERLVPQPDAGSRRLPDEVWLSLRLAFFPGPWSGDRACPADASILRLLLAGEIPRATSVLVGRLGGLGFRPPFYTAFADQNWARRSVAALAFPIHHKTAQRIARHLDSRDPGENA
ncbi:MAG: type I-U CRISPR-associated protein Csx17 [Planctomycetota bacterium]|nr:MAG: type I-U CRISPR-associated protein Csx17 [Planctomycetota bacterium]